MPSGMVWPAGMPWVPGWEVNVTVWLPPVLACGPGACAPVGAGVVACLVVSGFGVARVVGVAVVAVGCVAAAGDCGVAEGDGVAAGVVVPVGVVRPSSEAAG